MEEENRDDRLLSEIADDLGEKLTLESTSEHFDDGGDDDGVDDDDDVVYVINGGDDDDDDDEDEEGEFEFSFAGVEVKSPESAEVLFHNGQIRPSFPFIVENSEETAEKFGPPVKKLFVVPSSAAEDGVWRTEESTAEVSASAGSSSPEFRRKSNSTGFSRFWRMKDLLARSNSDGKDRFVFMPSKDGGVEKEKTKMKSMMKVVSLRRIRVGKKNEDDAAETKPTSGGGGGDKEGKKKVKKAASMSAAYEAFYGKKKGGSGSSSSGGGGGSEKSYLPYRVGFFTNASGMTRNVHPY